MAASTGPLELWLPVGFGPREDQPKNQRREESEVRMFIPLGPSLGRGMGVSLD